MSASDPHFAGLRDLYQCQHHLEETIAPRAETAGGSDWRDRHFDEIIARPAKVVADGAR